MKFIIILILFFVFLNCCFGLDDDRFLRAIAIVETNNDNSAVGKAGERSRYQFMRATWRQYSSVSHAKCSQLPLEVERVARLHLNWIKNTLKQNRFSATAENCAAVWNSGFTNFKRGKIRRQYVNRVSNLYRSENLIASN